MMVSIRHMCRCSFRLFLARTGGGCGGNKKQVEIRAASVQAVERLKIELSFRGVVMTSVEVDSWLRSEGDRLDNLMAPHHRALTVFY